MTVKREKRPHKNSKNNLFKTLDLIWMYSNMLMVVSAKIPLNSQILERPTDVKNSWQIDHKNIYLKIPGSVLKKILKCLNLGLAIIRYIDVKHWLKIVKNKSAVFHTNFRRYNFWKSQNNEDNYLVVGVLSLLIITHVAKYVELWYPDYFFHTEPGKMKRLLTEKQTFYLIKSFA